MGLMIYNSLTNKIEEFKTHEPGIVNMYVCGPTVYDYIHIGNARPVIFYDMLKNYLEYIGYKVNYASNITDVDDKIINKALEQGVSEEEIAKKYEDAYFKNCNDLGSKRPTFVPHATAYIKEMLDFIGQLVNKGYAYEVNGDVYFRVNHLDSYGVLSNQVQEELQNGVRKDVDTKKENPLDFVLWKKTNVGIKWPSIYGPGRPGWHTECVCMIDKIFNHKMIDIHGGGMDLKFPHHENEIAQSMAYNGHPIANYWMHNQMINIDGEKMSKSLGNVLWAKDLIVEFGCNVFKWLMLSTHYRNPLNLTVDVIAGVRKEVSKVENATKNASLYLQVNHVPAHDYKKETVDAMVNALEDDLNTSLALTQILDQVKVLNQVMRVREKDNDVIATEYATLVKMGDVLGFLFEGTKLSEEDIALYEEWNAYKKEKNFDEADRVRKELTERGIL